MSEFNLYPSILTGDMAIAQQQLDFSISQEQINTVQLDVIDGVFAENVTLTPADTPALNFDRLLVDLHLMTNEPIDFVHEAISAKHQLPVRAVLAQIERMSSQQHYVEEVRNQGWKVGVSLDIFTPVEEIEDHTWQFLDVVQLMAIEAGSQGRPFKPLVLEKILEVTAKIQQSQQQIEVVIDGSMNSQTIPQVLEAGADSVAVGSALWKSEDSADALQELLSL